jgi:hypothetical protein
MKMKKNAAVTIVLLLALSSHAFAAPKAPRSPAAKPAVSRLLEAVIFGLGWLEGLWLPVATDCGSSIDPSGACRDTERSAATPPTECRSGIDPSGACRDFQ